MYNSINDLLNADLSIPSLYELKNMDEISTEPIIPVIYKNISCINNECIDNTSYLQLVSKASIAPTDKQKRSKKVRKGKKQKNKKTKTTKKQKN